MNEPWDWDWSGSISENPNITMEFIKTYWNDITLSSLSKNKFFWDDVVYKRELARDIAERRDRIRRELRDGDVCDVITASILRYIDYA